MLDLTDIEGRLREHFSTVTPTSFAGRVLAGTPQTIAEGGTFNEQEDGEAATTQLVLFQAEPSPLPLSAYLASALSGLTEEQRRYVFHLSDTISVICRQNGIDLYEPRKKTDPVHHPEVPDSEVFNTDRERVLNSDLVIHLCHYPSTGAGEELSFAYDSLVPVILIGHSNSRVSRMITGITSFKLKIEYEGPEELRTELDSRLTEIRPILEQRKLAFTSYKANIVGTRVRLLREGLNLTREEVARAAPYVTEDILRTIETSADATSNPNLIQLRQIAAILKTTVADLVEPDLSERLFVLLQEWIEGKSSTSRAESGPVGYAARFDGLSAKDRNRILRRLLLRVIDSLEQ